MAPTSVLSSPRSHIRTNGRLPGNCIEKNRWSIIVAVQQDVKCTGIAEKNSRSVPIQQQEAAKRVGVLIIGEGETGPENGIAQAALESNHTPNHIGPTRKTQRNWALIADKTNNFRLQPNHGGEGGRIGQSTPPWWKEFQQLCTQSLRLQMPTRWCH